MLSYRKVRKSIENILTDTKINYFIWRSRKYEENKFRDSRRVEIANQFPLTKEMRQQIDDFFLTNYGEKIDYVWHRNYAAHANRFDYCFFPEVLYIPEFERFQNQNPAACRMLGDKNFLPIVAKAAGVSMPLTIISCTNGILRDQDNHIISDIMANELLQAQSRAFVKPTTSSCSGQGCRLLSKNDNCRISGNALIFSSINEGGYTSNYVIQSVVSTHPALSALHPESVNTFRIITYIWKGVVENMPVILRIGRGKSNVDNAHAGGMFIAVCENGKLGDHAVTEFNMQFTTHPDSEIVFKDYQLPSYNLLVAAAKRMHELVPQIGVVNWDFTIDADGQPVLIEANLNGGSVWLPQMAHGVGAFGDRSAEVLQWLRFMKKTKPHERLQFINGKAC